MCRRGAGLRKKIACWPIGVSDGDTCPEDLLRPLENEICEGTLAGAVTGGCHETVHISQWVVG